MARMPWFLVLLLSACAASPLRPATEKLQPWTTHLRDQQSGEAFAAVYKRGAHRLVFVAAQHANRDDSATFRLIREAYENFHFDTVIAEGFPTSRGANPPSVIKYAAENGANAEGFVEGGETVPTVLGAGRQRANLWGGEADDVEVKAQVLSAGFSAADLLGFYVLRSIPQWIAEHKIDSAGDSRLKPLVESALARNRVTLRLPNAVLSDYSQWASWYSAANRKPIDAGFVTEEVGPLADGKFYSNRIAYAVSRARDSYLHQLIISHLKAKENVLVVYGASHLMIQRPALDAAIGRPCYVGTELARSVSACP